jgi:hypothetical protein
MAAKKKSQGRATVLHDDPCRECDGGECGAPAGPGRLRGMRALTRAGSP